MLNILNFKPNMFNNDRNNDDKLKYKHKNNKDIDDRHFSSDKEIKECICAYDFWKYDPP